MTSIPSITLRCPACAARKINGAAGRGIAKTFTAPETWRGRKVYIEFQAVRQFGEVYLNGQRLGICKNGFIPFGFDLTPYVKVGVVNTLAVMCDNRFMFNPMPDGKNDLASDNLGSYESQDQRQDTGGRKCHRRGRNPVEQPPVASADGRHLSGCNGLRDRPIAHNACRCTIFYRPKGYMFMRPRFRKNPPR